MNIWKQKSKIILTCPWGVSRYLKAEIESLGFAILKEIDTAVQIQGTLEDTLLLNLHLRTAQRVLYQLQEFKAVSPGALYERIAALPWENILHSSGAKAYICITSHADNALVTDSRFINVKVKDAIVDRLRDHIGSRPDSGPDKDKAVIHVYWREDRAVVYIDTSGERLSLRGYRKIPWRAPLSEILAAALVAACDWRGRGTFVNPMCGSGTLAIEAALMALQRAPGLSRNNYGFMYILGYSAEYWQELRKKAHQLARKKFPVKIIATDIDEAAVHAARLNAQTAGVGRQIEFLVCPYEKTPLPAGGGVILVNPPYGERLEAGKSKSGSWDQKKEVAPGKQIIIRKASARSHQNAEAEASCRLEALYGGIGDFFKNNGGGYRGYIFTGNPEMIKKVGLRTKRRLTFYNGEIECRLLEYELYAGSRKKPASSAKEAYIAEAAEKNNKEKLN